MPFSSLLGGKKPKLRQATPGELALLEHSQTLRSDPAAQQMLGLRGMLGDSLASGREGQRTTMMGQAAGTVAQQFAGPVTDSRDAVDMAVARGRGLSRVLGGTREQFDNQLMRDRISFVQQGRQRQGMGLSAMAHTANIQDSLASARAGRRQVESTARRDMFGTVAGAGLRAWTEHRPLQSLRNNRTPTADVTTGVDVSLSPWTGGLA